MEWRLEVVVEVKGASLFNDAKCDAGCTWSVSDMATCI